MGAVDQIDFIEGPTLHSAYQTACENAASEYGHPYSGQINMSNGIFLAVINDGDGNRRVEKWEQAGAIQIASAGIKERTIELTIDTTDLDEAQTQVAKATAEVNKQTAQEGLECIKTLLESSSNIFDNPEYALSVLQRGEQQCKTAIARLQTLDEVSTV